MTYPLGSRPRSWTVAIAVFLTLAVAAEIIARLPAVALYIATEPANIVSYPAFVAKLQSFASLRQPKVMLVGASEALGQVMTDYGVKDWQSRGLSAALAEALRPQRPDIVIANFAGNGLLPADQAAIMLEGMRAGADAIVLVADLRGFSDEFEPPDDRYAQPWRTTGPLRPLPEPGRSQGGSIDGGEYSLSAAWRTKAVVDFLITDETGGPVPAALTELRDNHQAARRASKANQAVQTMRLKQRLSSVGFDLADRFQARQLAGALKILNTRGVPVIVVYATENPGVLPRLMAPGAVQRDRAALEAMVAANGGGRDVYLGPDPAMTPGLYVDPSHPTPEGYRVMARRIAPELLKLALSDQKGHR